MQSVVHDPAHSPLDPSPAGTQHAALSWSTREDNPEKGQAEVNPRFEFSCALARPHSWPRAAASASDRKAIINIIMPALAPAPLTLLLVQGTRGRLPPGRFKLAS